jgi:hypothetical protein
MQPTGLRRLAVQALLVAAVAAPLAAQTKYPYIDAVHPVAVSRGTSVEVRIQASGNLKTAHAVLVDGDGVRAEVLPRSGEEGKKLPDGAAAVRIEAAPDAPPGIRDIRLVTEEAITTSARFYVTDLPVTVEKDSHGTRAESQEIPVPTMVCGRVGGGVEVDWYRFEAKKGERVNFNLLGARLHETIHHVGRFTPHFDAFLTVTDAEGRELAVNDDHYFADPLLSFELPADGVYHLAVREANYKGHASYTYALSVTKGPCAALAFPLAAAPGKTADVEIVGPGIAPGERAQVTLRPDAAPGRTHAVRPRRADGKDADEILVVASELPVVLEAEKSGARSNDRPESAEEISLPAGVAGRIGDPDDIDCFTFQAVKGTAYRFAIHARRLWSSLDSELAVLGEGGKPVASADDARDLAGRSTKDSLLSWTAPADGRFTLRVRDLHQRGGPAFAYHLECSVQEPGFELTLDPEISMIGPGNRSPVYVRARRLGGFDGRIDLEVQDLPQGMTALAPPILPGMTDACVILAAAADAPRGGSLFRVVGKAAVTRAGGEVVIARDAVPLAEIYQARRVEGRTAGAAVTAPSDIEVTTEVKEVILKPGETQVIPIRLIRGPRYKSGSVTLWAMWRYEGAVFGSSLPPGVTVDEGQSKTSLNGEAVEGQIALRAAADAKPISRVQTAVIGLVPIEFSVFVPYATPPILLSVTNKDGSLAAAP